MKIYNSSSKLADDVKLAILGPPIPRLYGDPESPLFKYWTKNVESRLDYYWVGRCYSPETQIRSDPWPDPQSPAQLLDYA